MARAILIALVILSTWPISTAAEEYVVRNPDGSVKERITKNPLTGEHDVRDTRGKRTGSITTNPLTGEIERKDTRGRVIERYEKRR